MADPIISNVNAKIVGTITGTNWMNVLGWFFFALIAIGAGYWYFGVYLRDRKLYKKNITTCDEQNGYYDPIIRDTAKVVKIGKNGFEILYLKKAKVYKIAYGGVGSRDNYMFFIMPDGYWYNGRLKAGLYTMNDDGLVKVVTTNPLMRSHYTSLEKQIDDLHKAKTNFWDKYGGWVMSIAFVLVAGVLLWLNYKEFSSAMGGLGNFIDRLSTLIDKLNLLTANVQTTPTGSGLVPV